MVSSFSRRGAVASRRRAPVVSPVRENMLLKRVVLGAEIKMSRSPFDRHRGSGGGKCVEVRVRAPAEGMPGQRRRRSLQKQWRGGALETYVKFVFLVG